MATKTVVIPPQPGAALAAIVIASHTAGAKDTIMDSITPMTQDATSKPYSYGVVVG